MRRIIYMLFLLILSGCAVTDEVSNEPETPGMTRHFIAFRQVRTGMTRQEIESVLALPIITGYELKDPLGEQYQPVTLKNPYRFENYTKGNQSYVIDYYLAGITRQDDQVSDEELMPLVYQNDKLVGLGWDFTRKLKSEK